MEQVSPVIADNEFNAEPFYARPSNLQLQHWWTDNNGLLKSQDDRTQHPACAPCVTLEYINIRGHEGYNVSVWMAQDPQKYHLHIDSHFARGASRAFKSATNSSIGGLGEDNFGFYLTVNPLHRCSSGDNSTTQWWLGEH